MINQNLDNVWTAQSFLSQDIVDSKIENLDFEIQIAAISDDGVMVYMLVDGHHSLAAARALGIHPAIVMVASEYKSLVDYVTAFCDLSNPVNIATGLELW